MRFLTSFYVVNFLSVVLYLVPRIRFALADPLDSGRHLYSKADFFQLEWKLIGGISMLLAYRFTTRRSHEDFLLPAILVLKGVVLYLVYLIDFHYLAPFAALYVAVMATQRPPPYTGPKSYARPLLPQELQAQTATGRWLLFFRSPHSHASNVVAPVFGEISTEFESKQLHFAEVDVAAWPDVASKHKISQFFWDGQVPTMILLERGKELARLPPVPRQDTAAPKVRWHKKSVIDAFGLRRGQPASNKGRAA